MPAVWRDFRGNWICKKGERKERKKKLFPWGSAGPFFIAAESALNGTAG